MRYDVASKQQQQQRQTRKDEEKKNGEGQRHTHRRHKKGGGGGVNETQQRHPIIEARGVVEQGGGTRRASWYIYTSSSTVWRNDLRQTVFEVKLHPILRLFGGGALYTSPPPPPPKNKQTFPLKKNEKVSAMRKTNKHGLGIQLETRCKKKNPKNNEIRRNWVKNHLPRHPENVLAIKCAMCYKRLPQRASDSSWEFYRRRLSDCGN